MGFATQLFAKHITMIYYVQLVLLIKMVVLFLKSCGPMYYLKNKNKMYCWLFCPLFFRFSILLLATHIKIWILHSLSVIGNFSVKYSSVLVNMVFDTMIIKGHIFH